jgi:hypothetical protein
MLLREDRSNTICIAVQSLVCEVETGIGELLKKGNYPFWIATSK